MNLSNLSLNGTKVCDICGKLAKAWVRHNGYIICHACNTTKE